MKTKSYKYGPHRCKAYWKNVGRGYEIGFEFGNHPIFVGNFIHVKEATYWWNYMNKEIGSFAKKFGFGPNAPIAWYRQFFSSHLYKMYYSYLDREFTKYQKNYCKAWEKDEKRYKQFKKNWKSDEQFHFKKSA